MTQLRRDRIGFVFQSFNLVPTLTALENITLPMDIAGKKPDQAWLDSVIDTLGIRDRLSHRPSEMSGGQQQRVACARALASRPEIIFGDEPTGNLDSRASGEVLGILRDSVSRLGQTVVIVTHDPRAASYADRVIFLADGRIVDEMANPTAAGRARPHEAARRRQQPGGLTVMASAMRRVSLRNLGAHKVRLVLTVISVVLGTAFVSGSFVFTDTLQRHLQLDLLQLAQGRRHPGQAGQRPQRRRADQPGRQDPSPSTACGRSSSRSPATALLIGTQRQGRCAAAGRPAWVGSGRPPSESIDTPPTITSGSAPTQTDQVAINESAAKKAHLVAGDKAKVLVPTSGVIDVTITGIYHLKTATGGYVGILFPQAQARAAVHRRPARPVHRRRRQARGERDRR